MLKSLRLTTAAAMGAVMLAPCAVTAQSWPDGDIELIIPSGPGGGFDVYGRVLARAMEETLDVTIVPQNVSGGGGMRGASVAYQADPDGQTFAVFNVPGIIQPIINGEDVAYDIDQIDWLGAMAFNQYIVVVSADSDISSVADLQALEDGATFTAYGSSGVAANQILCAELEIECQIITGYPSNNEALLGVVRGDAMASVTPIYTATAFNTNGDLRGVLLMTDRDAADFADTQKAADAGYPALASLGLIRAFGLPPGLGEDTRAAFQEVFDTALTSDSVSAWVSETGNAFDPMSADELSALIAAQTELLMRYQDVLAAQ
jgi:tripartite-type tricarboxylate transporter receptor subunit TctC